MEYMPMYEPPGPPLCQAPRRTACDSRAAIDQNLPDGDGVGLCIAQDRQQASIRQLQARYRQSAVRWGTLNTTDAEPPASGIDSTAVSDGPLVKSTRSPSAPQVADPFGPSSTRCRGAEPSRRSTDRSRELPAILRSREPSGVEITESVAGHTAPERRRVPPTNERSQPVHVAVSHAAARIRVPSPLQAYTSIPTRVCDPLRFACVDDADLNARRDRHTRGIFHLERCARMSPEDQAGSR